MSEIDAKQLSMDYGRRVRELRKEKKPHTTPTIRNYGSETGVYQFDRARSYRYAVVYISENR